MNRIDRLTAILLLLQNGNLNQLQDESVVGFFVSL